MVVSVAGGPIRSHPCGLLRVPSSSSPMRRAAGLSTSPSVPATGSGEVSRLRRGRQARHGDEDDVGVTRARAARDPPLSVDSFERATPRSTSRPRVRVPTVKTPSPSPSLDHLPESSFWSSRLFIVYFYLAHRVLHCIQKRLIKVRPLRTSTDTSWSCRTRSYVAKPSSPSLRTSPNSTQLTPEVSLSPTRRANCIHYPSANQFLIAFSLTDPTCHILCAVCRNTQSDEWSFELQVCGD